MGGSSGARRKAQTFTYTGFLRRDGDQLRIRLEDETPATPERP